MLLFFCGGGGIFLWWGYVHVSFCCFVWLCFIVGGANSAGQAAMYFSAYARRVVMLVRGSSLAAGMSQYLIEQIKQTPNIHVELNSQVTEAFGTDRLEAISILCSTSGETQTVPAECF